MKQQLMTLLLGAASVFCSCETQLEQHVKSELRAPAYPLVRRAEYLSIVEKISTLIKRYWNGGIQMEMNIKRLRNTCSRR